MNAKLDDYRLYEGDWIIYSQGSPRAPQWSNEWCVEWVGPHSKYPGVESYNVVLHAQYGKQMIGMIASERGLIRDVLNGHASIVRKSAAASV